MWYVSLDKAKQRVFKDMLLTCNKLLVRIHDIERKILSPLLWGKDQEIKKLEQGMINLQISVLRLQDVIFLFNFK